MAGDEGQTPLEELREIHGSREKQNLENVGISSVEELAAVEKDRLASVSDFHRLRAQRLIKKAREYLDARGIPIPDEVEVREIGGQSEPGTTNQGLLDPVDAVLAGRVTTERELEDLRDDLTEALADAEQAHREVSKAYAEDEVSFSEVEAARRQEKTLKGFVADADALLEANAELGDRVEAARAEAEATENERRALAEAYAEDEATYEELQAAVQAAEDAQEECEELTSTSFQDLAAQLSRSDDTSSSRPGNDSRPGEGARVDREGDGLQDRRTAAEGEQEVGARRSQDASRSSTGLWNRLETWEKVALASALGVVLGGLGPWVDVVFRTLYGLQGDGWFLAVPAGIVVYLVARKQETPHGGVGLLFLGTGAFAGWKIYDLIGIEMFGESIGWALMSWGLPVAAASSLIGYLAVFWKMETGRRKA